MSTSNHSEDLMAKAIALANSPTVPPHPNPRVGCVMVKDGDIIGEGFHAKAGTAHAEVMALAEAGDDANGATCYVTLEPCAHQGRTPACINALIAAKVKKVVVAMLDPNPLVNGQGVKALMEAGIDVEVGLREDDAIALNPGFVSRMSLGRPRVICKMAMSLDGKIAMASGESQWITSEQARVEVHKLRASSSALMTGIGTVLADNPSLTVRGLPYEAKPIRVVIDSSLRLPADAKVCDSSAPTIVATADASSERSSVLADAGIPVIHAPAADSDKVNLTEVLNQLATDYECNDVLVEAGSVLSGALLSAGLVDELVCFVAPKLMGAGAQSAFVLPNITQLSEHIGLEIIEIKAVGPDWMVRAAVV